jgi:hypothetical protein
MCFSSIARYFPIDEAFRLDLDGLHVSSHFSRL